jgi:low temperature requirement protein LtrA
LRLRLGNLRRTSDEQRVAPIELFFDLVYVFAVTQLSHHLLADVSIKGALQTALLLAMVWLVWVYTTWVTNWLDPWRLPLRVLLLWLMLMSLILSACLPEAFGSRGLAVGCCYAAMQVVRSAFTVAALEGDPPLQRNFQRITCWCLVSGTFAVLGGFGHGDVRACLWVLAVSTDVAGSTVGFWVPGLGRSTTQEWTIRGDLLAERCQAFILIALGESVVVIGSTLSGIDHISLAQVGAVVSTFVGCVALWWLYFDRSAEGAALVIEESEDPGRLGRSAYHQIHPIMVAGILVTAAADQLVIVHPGRTADGATTWLVLGGTGLFVAGHAIFKATVWRVVPRTRLLALVVLGLLGFLVGHVSSLTLGCCAAVVVAAVAASDARSATYAPSPAVSS